VSSWARSEAQTVSEHKNRSANTITKRLRVPYHLMVPIVVGVDIIVVVGISLLSGIGYHFSSFGFVGGLESYLAFGALTFTNMSAVLAARGDYRVSNLVSFKRQARDVLFIWTSIFLLLLGLVFSLKAGESLSRGATFMFFFLGLAGMIAWRGLLAQYLQFALSRGAFTQRNVIVIGEHSRLTTSCAISDLLRCGYTPIRTFELYQEDVARDQISHALQEIADGAIEAARSETAVEILLLIGWEHSCAIESITKMLCVLPIPIHLLPDENVSRYLSRTIDVGTTWAAEIQRAPLTRTEQVVKRCFDVFAAASVLLLLSPLMLLTALLVKLDSRGPILFFQARNGFNGRAFRIMKFRSMNVLEDGHIIRQVTRSDPRVTRLGRWLRRTNIDELPQLFNVLYGNMSLVGPRPHAIAHNSEYEKCIANYAFRHHVKPGITGWAQVNGYRGETPTTDLMAKRVELDLWYVNNWNMWLDIRILLRTLVLGLQPTGY
jgi:Undecaprenyl-phosphate glucose phosphotransferase